MDGGAGGEIGPWEDFEVGIDREGRQGRRIPLEPPSRIASTCNAIAAANSSRLWGGMRVAIPTAIPSLPLSRRFGRRAGRTVGSCSESSKFGWKATVSLSMSSSMWAAILPRRDSVYLIAAGGSPSMEPKFP